MNSSNCFQIYIYDKKYNIFFMGKGVREILITEDKIYRGFLLKRVKSVKTPIGFNNWEDFYNYHKDFFSDKARTGDFLTIFN